MWLQLAFGGVSLPFYFFRRSGEVREKRLPRSKVWLEERSEHINAMLRTEEKERNRSKKTPREVIGGEGSSNFSVPGSREELTLSASHLGSW